MEGKSRSMVTFRPLLIFLSLWAITWHVGPWGMPDRVSHRVFAVLLCILFVWTASAIVRVRTIRGLAGTRADFVCTLAWLDRGKRAIFFLTCLLFVWIIVGLGWPSVVRVAWRLDRVPLFDELVIISPLVMGLVGSSLILRLAEDSAAWKLHRLRYPLTDWLEWNPRILSAVRAEHAPWILITLFVLFTSDVVGWIEPWSAEAASWIGLFMMGTFTLAGLPLVLRLSLPLERFPDGRLRSVLDRWAEIRRAPLRDILIWQSPQDVANAALTGAWARFRYVLLSRSLVDHLLPAQLLGVFGHEVGHARHRHLWHLLGVVMMMVASALLLAKSIATQARGQLPPPWSDLEQELILAGTAFVVALPLYLLIGWMSRQFEFQADLEGCRAASVGIARIDGRLPSSDQATEILPEGVRVFGSGLERVAIYNGMDPDRWSWRGGRLRDRILFLQKVEADGRIGADFDRRLLRRLQLIYVSLGIVLALSFCLL
ncbi:M48 family metalloprotease [bacterium]|nr:M48 family metalloprotease [bacterium]